MLAEGQNLSRRLMETPANYMTPTIFAKNAVDILGKLENVEVIARYHIQYISSVFAL